MEVWITIKKSPKYEVSNLGRVRNINTGRVRSFENNSQKYIKFSTTIDKRRFSYYVHRLVAMYFVPNPEGKPQVNHIDGDKHNNSADNLEWCTQEENMSHAISSRLLPKSSPKLKAEDVLEIRDKLSKGYTYRQLSKEYNIGINHVYSINHRLVWKNI